MSLPALPPGYYWRIGPSSLGGARIQAMKRRAFLPDREVYYTYLTVIQEFGMGAVEDFAETLWSTEGVKP